MAERVIGDGIERPAVVVDCDPGHDDVIALLVAQRFCELVAITTVSGNAPLADCTRNALTVAEMFGLDVPVAPGCDRPLVQPAFHGSVVHGANGLGGPEVAAPRRRPERAHAVEVIIESTRAREGIWLVPTGPLTNLAIALRLDPPLVDRIAGISLMGGGIGFGNVTSTAEFNVWADPEAASVVFGCEARRRMCGLDVTHQVIVTAEHAEQVRAIGSPRASFLAELLTYFADRMAQFSGLAGGPMHDPLAVLALTHPHLFGFTDLPIRVELAGEQRGTTIADGGPRHSDTAVAMTVDEQALLGIVLETLELAAAPGGGTLG